MTFFKKSLWAFFASVLFIVALGLPGLSWATTYYLSPSGNDTTGDGSSGSPWKTAAHAGGQVSCGDTVIWKDGTYDTSDDDIDDAEWPDCAADNRITLEAQNYGSAVLDGGGSNLMVHFGDTSGSISGYNVYGFKLINCGTGGTGSQCVSIDGPDDLSSPSHDIDMAWLSVQGGNDIGNAFRIARSYNINVSTSLVYGMGRYPFHVFGSSAVHLDTIIVRFDGFDVSGLASKHGDPRAPIDAYNVHNSTFENILILDSSSNWTTGGTSAGFYVPSNAGTPSTWDDSVALYFYNILMVNNDFGNGWNSESGSGSVNDDIHVDGMAMYNQNGTGVSISKNASNHYLYHVTVSSSGSNATYNGGGGNAVSNCSIRDSILEKNGGGGTRGLNGPWADSDYNLVDGFGVDNYSGVTAGANDINEPSQQLYITRIEDGTPPDSQDEYGLDMGATILFATVNGSTEAGTHLWPWPGEDRWKTDLCDAGNPTDRSGEGLCGSGVSITTYVWNAMGNTIPSSIYGDSSPSSSSGGVPGLGGGLKGGFYR